MAYWLDYSAGKLTGTTIRNAGYTGAVRYIDAPANLSTKHTNRAEYDSLRAAGLTVLLVMQTTTTASDGGFPVGQDHARRALAGAEYLGYTGPIFFTNDRTTVPNPSAWRAYLDGAASVLGVGRVGAYGFRNAMDLAVGHASYFWQAGRRSDVASHVHLWQDNNVQVTVGGITCDRNLVLKDIVPVAAAPTRARNKMAVLVKGDKAPNTFKVEFDNSESGAIAVRTAVPNPADPGYVIALAAYGPVVTVAQAVIDAVPDKKPAPAQSAPAPVQVDAAQLAAALEPVVAQAVADELARRLAA